MHRALDPASPVPLYHQIVEIVRYEIATGRLRAGEALPGLREASEAFGVNLHTVRHAHQELEREGLVEVRPGKGAVVVGRKGSGVAAFVERVAREARARHGLSRGALAELLAKGGDRMRRGGAPVVHVIECSDTQCVDLAAQIAAKWDVDARPWCLDTPGAPPEGGLVATYFHYNDLRRRAPERLEQIGFVVIRPDPAVGARVAERMFGGRGGVLLVEQTETAARSIAADLAALGVAARPVVVRGPGEALERAKDGDVVLFSPRMWGAMTARQRKDERAVQVRYVIDSGALVAIGERFGWEERTGAVGESELVRRPDSGLKRVGRGAGRARVGGRQKGK